MSTRATVELSCPGLGSVPKSGGAIKCHADLASCEYTKIPKGSFACVFLSISDGLSEEDLVLRFQELEGNPIQVCNTFFIFFFFSPMTLRQFQLLQTSSSLDLGPGWTMEGVHTSVKSVTTATGTYGLAAIVLDLKRSR